MGWSKSWRFKTGQAHRSREASQVLSAQVKTRGPQEAETAADSDPIPRGYDAQNRHNAEGPAPRAAEKAVGDTEGLSNRDTTAGQDCLGFGSSGWEAASIT